MSGKKRTIIVGFSTPIQAWKSAPIRLIDKAPYSHVYIKMYSKTVNRWLIYHASHHSLHFLSKKSFAWRNKVIKEYKMVVPESSFVKVLQYCIDKAGTPYSYTSLLGIAMVKLLCKASIFIENPFKDGEKTQVCHEVAAHILDILGEDIDLNKAESASPKWLDGILEGLVQRGKATHIKRLG